MTSITRTITTSILDWRGIIIRVTFERQRWSDHLTVQSIEPERCPLSITPTGFRSAFLPKGEIAEGDDPAAYVENMLDRAAVSARWASLEIEVRQHALF